MQALIWIGTAVTLVGITGFLAVGYKVNAARREGLEDDALKDRIQKLLPLNLGALFVSATGLMMVIIGLALN
jgi:hypothetical protein